MKKDNPLIEGSNCCEDYEWEDLCDEITNLMDNISTTNNWKAEMHNFGWQSLSGSKEFAAKNGRELLQNILPNTECIFKIYKIRKTIKIVNSHHDSPMGNEYYIIKPRK